MEKWHKPVGGQESQRAGARGGGTNGLVAEGFRGLGFLLTVSYPSHLFCSFFCFSLLFCSFSSFFVSREFFILTVSYPSHVFCSFFVSPYCFAHFLHFIKRVTHIMLAKSFIKRVIHIMLSKSFIKRVTHIMLTESFAKRVTRIMLQKVVLRE